ncbi:MAG: AAA family ATPase [Ilumatobacteraceae bacterium]
MSGHLILICGLPGAGKTTLATRFTHERNAVRLCADDWMVALGIDLWDAQARARIELLQGALALDLLRTGATVVIEWGLWSRAERDLARTEARRLGATVELHYLAAPVEELHARIEARGRELHHTGRAITLAELREWATIIEPPTPDELTLYDPHAA